MRSWQVGSESLRGNEEALNHAREGGVGMTRRLLSIPETAECIGSAPGTLRNPVSRGDRLPRLSGSRR
jgi:hypothetical protein